MNKLLKVLSQLFLLPASVDALSVRLAYVILGEESVKRQTEAMNGARR